MNGCDKFSEMISAHLDGDLELAECHRLEAHLAECHECQERLRIFQQIDGACRQGRPELPGELRAKVAHRIASRHTSRPVGWLVRSALAASIVAAAAFLWIPKNRAVDANQISVPLADLYFISYEEQQTQDTLSKTLELDLRALRLELQSLQADPETLASLSDRIDRLIARVRHTRVEDIGVDAGEEN
jgi:predicted anti-sigma-YlaC factor YlaD